MCRYFSGSFLPPPSQLPVAKPKRLSGGLSSLEAVANTSLAPQVSDAKPKRLPGGLSSMEVVASCIVAWGSLLFMGDADGVLMVWDTASGRSSSLATGAGVARRMQLAPPTNPQVRGSLNPKS